MWNVWKGRKNAQKKGEFSRLFSAMVKQENDSDDSDSDYDPAQETEVVEEGLEVDESKTTLSGIGFKRKRVAEDTWKSMLQDDEKKETKKNVLRPLSDVTISKIYNANEEKKGHKEKVSSQLNDMMAMIFGSKKKTENTKNKKASTESNSEHSISVKDILKDSVKSLKKKEKVIDTRKFAGQEIKVERTMQIGEVNTSVAIEKDNTLDKVLDTLKGPKVVSTVAKSSYDWDNFKEKEGLEDDLAVAKKDGYLTKKDFLERCDYRKFEQERDARNLLRAQQGSQAPALD